MKSLLTAKMYTSKAGYYLSSSMFISFFVASLAAPAAPAAAKPPPAASSGNGTSGGAAAATSPVPSSSGKPEYPKDLGNGVEMINREDCPGGYCEMGHGIPCCPQLPPSPCGGQQQPSCQLGPPPQGCNSPCPPSPMMGR